MRMLQNNLLVKKLTREQLGKIVLPDSVQPTWFRGKVLGIGVDVKGDIKVGDVIVFLPGPTYLGGEYPIVDDNGSIVIPENYICAIEEPLSSTIGYSPPK